MLYTLRLQLFKIQKMLNIIFQWCLVLCVVVFMVYVFYNRYAASHQQSKRSRSDTYRNTVQDIHTAKNCAQKPTIDTYSSPNGKRYVSPVPPLAQPENPASQQLLYKPEDVNRQYAPVWIPVDTQMSKVLQKYTSSLPIQSQTQNGVQHCALNQNASIPDFADVFRGYQRLALLTIFTTFGQHHKIIFVHKGNWHILLPNLVGHCAIQPHFRSEAMNESMRMDYIKANLLAYYGGYWIPPDTILIQPQFNSFITQTVIAQARKQNDALLDTPLMVVSEKYELHTNNENTFTTDTTLMYAEPRNPTLLAIANQLQVIVTKSFNNSGYEYNNYFEHTIYQYKSSGKHPKDSASILVLPPHISCSVDDQGDMIN